MPHEIESLAFAGATPWHGLGTPLYEADTNGLAAGLRQAGLNWEVQTVPLVTADKQESVTHVAVRRSSDAGASRSRTEMRSSGSNLSSTVAKPNSKLPVRCAGVLASGCWRN
jgi:hypothetical protein